MLEITTKPLRRCELLKIEGRVDSASVVELKNALDSITDAGRHNIVLNLSGVLFMSSAGLRQLLDTQKKCKSLKRGDLVLAEVPQKIKDVLDLSGLTEMFKIYETDVEAVGDF
jgi:anti-sigma B factor antagonist